MGPDAYDDQSGSSGSLQPKESAATSASGGTATAGGEPTTFRTGHLQPAVSGPADDVTAPQPQPKAPSAYGIERVAGQSSVTLRNDMVQKAVDFLLSRQVLASSKPLQDKMDFLVRKGLTTDEVAEAVQRARLSGLSLGGEAPAQLPATGLLPPVQQPGLPPRVPQPLQTPPLSAASRAKRLALTAAAVGALAYGAYHVYTVYVRPFVSSRLNRRSSSVGRGGIAKEALAASVEQVLGRLNESVTQLSQTIADQQQLLVQLAARVDGQKATGAPFRDDRPAPSFEDLKAEILSVKRLLLSKSQFPPAPVASPVLPAWQIESTKSIRESVTNAGVPATAGASRSSESGSAVVDEPSPSSETSGSGHTASTVSDRTLTSGPMPSGESDSAATGINENVASSSRGADLPTTDSESSSYVEKPDVVTSGDTA